MADTPLLGGNNGARRSKDGYGSDSRPNILGSIWKIFSGGLIAPADTTYATIKILLNCTDAEEQNQLTKEWRDHKLNELSFIGVVSPMTTMCLVSTGSWPEISHKPWYIRAIWYCGIIFALFSVLTAAQQTLRLHRLSAHRDGLHYIRLCLVKGRKRSDSEGGEEEFVPRPFQVWSWQSSMMFLLMAVACLLGGMMVLVWSAVVKDTGNVVYDENTKLALSFTVVLGATLLYYFATQVSIMGDIKVSE